MKKIGLSFASLTFLSILIVGCASFENDKNEDEFNQTVAAANILATTDMLEQDLGGALAGKNLEISLSPTSPNVGIAYSSVPDVLKSASDFVINKYIDLVKQNNIDLQHAYIDRDKFINEVNGDLTKTFTETLNNSWNDFIVAEKKTKTILYIPTPWPFDDIDVCDADISVKVWLSNFYGAKSKINDITFKMEPAASTMNTHVHLKDFSSEPQVHYKASISAWCISDFSFSGDLSVPVTIGDMEFDMNVVFEKKKQENYIGCNDDSIVQATANIENVVVSNLTKNVPPITAWYNLGICDLVTLGLASCDWDDIDKTVDPDDYLSNEMTVAKLNERLKTYKHTVIEELKYDKMAISDFLMDENSITFTPEFDPDGDGLFKCDPCPNSHVNIEDDKDNICYDQDNCPSAYNPDQKNTDGDSEGDVCDSCPLIKNIGDNEEECYEFSGVNSTVCINFGDGVDDSCDNCAEEFNKLQEDFDGDGIGDACDDDIDNDGLPNETDKCKHLATTNNEDSDGDNVGDACDNCLEVANTPQSDIDGDKLGDACDSDMDGDDVLNVADNCPEHFNPGQEDTDNDDKGNACESLCDYDNMPTAWLEACEGMENFMKAFLKLQKIKECVGTKCVIDFLPSQFEKLIQATKTGGPEEQKTAIRILGAYGSPGVRTRAEIQWLIQNARNREVVTAAREAMNWLEFRTLQFDKRATNLKNLAKATRFNKGFMQKEKKNLNQAKNKIPWLKNTGLRTNG